ncbi:hypothetical protein Hanom_Chr10g00966181 [Helianthus anomalus]
MKLYIYMEPIKSNQLSNQYPPLDLAEIKSQPLKLIKITSLMAVSRQFFTVSSSSPFYLPTSGNLRPVSIFSSSRRSSLHIPFLLYTSDIYADK